MNRSGYSVARGDVRKTIALVFLGTCGLAALAASLPSRAARAADVKFTSRYGGAPVPPEERIEPLPRARVETRALPDLPRPSTVDPLLPGDGDLGGRSHALAGSSAHHGRTELSSVDPALQAQFELFMRSREVDPALWEMFEAFMRSRERPHQKTHNR